MPKSFLTYQQQIDKLVIDKNLIVTDRDYAEKMLKLISYYALISGYKSPYRDTNTQKYKDGTTFEEIVALYKFDENLRELFLKYLLKIEQHVRSLLSYYFTEQHGENQASYLSADNYSANSKHRKGIQKLVKILSDEAQKSNTPYIKYQRITYNNVPLWVLVNALTFGTLSKIYQFIPSRLQSKISKEFPKVNEKQLQQYLSVLTKYRNVCAHNERLFSYKSSENIPDTVMHIKLNIPRRGSQFKCGKGDLFAVVIAFRYLLPKHDFMVFKRNLGRIIEFFCKQTEHVSEGQLLDLMGFPLNWKKVSTFRV